MRLSLPLIHTLRSPSSGLLHVLLLFTVGVSFFLALGSVPLFDVDEGAFSQATREMFLRGDFLSTYLYGEPRHDKPILSYWLQALSVGLLGFNEWGFRLPSALLATGWVAATYIFVLRVRHDKVALGFFQSRQARLLRSIAVRRLRGTRTP